MRSTYKKNLSKFSKFIIDREKKKEEVVEVVIEVIDIKKEKNK